MSFLASLFGRVAAKYVQAALTEPLRKIYYVISNDGFPRGYNESDKALCGRTRTLWKRLDLGDYYIAWDGPLKSLKESFDYAKWSDRHLAALRREYPNLSLKFAQPFRIDEYEKEGYRQLFETDCRTWRRRILDRDQFEMMIKERDRLPPLSPLRVVNRWRSRKNSN